MRLFTALTAIGLSCFTTNVSVAQIYTDIWKDSATTRQALADTSKISPFLTAVESRPTKRSEKVEAIQNYARCESVFRGEQVNRFYGLTTYWAKAQSRIISKAGYQSLGEYERDKGPLKVPFFTRADIDKYLSGDSNLVNIAPPTLMNVSGDFQYWQEVRPLIRASQLAAIKKDQMRRFFPMGCACREQVRVMYPAYAVDYPEDVFPQVAAEKKRQEDLYKSEYQVGIAPWLLSRKGSMVVKQK